VRRIGPMACNEVSLDDVEVKLGKGKGELPLRESDQSTICALESGFKDGYISEDKKSDETESGCGVPDDADKKSPFSCESLWAALYSGFQLVTKQWFLFAMLAAMVLAYPLREIGRDSSILVPKYTVKLPGVIMIFLSRVLCLDPSSVRRAFSQYHIIAFTTIFSFVVYPAVVMVIATCLKFLGYNQFFRVGMIVTSVVPTTTAMSAILTTLSGGHVPIAVANATLNNLMGFVCTPALVMLLLSGTVDVDMGTVALKLTYSILLPFVCAQGLRRIETIKNFAMANQRKFSIFNHIVLVVIIFCSFCNLFSMKLSDYGIEWYHIVMQFFLNVTIHLIVCVLAWIATPWASMSDRVAVFFVAVQKTIVMGLPMLNELFDNDPLRDIYALPLIMYHPIELFLGILIGGRLRKLIDAPSCPQAGGEEVPPSPVFRGSVCRLLQAKGFLDVGDKEGCAATQEVVAQGLSIIPGAHTHGLVQAGIPLESRSEEKGAFAQTGTIKDLPAAPTGLGGPTSTGHGVAASAARTLQQVPMASQDKSVNAADLSCGCHSFCMFPRLLAHV